MNWNDLSMADRAAYIKLGLDSGITDLGVIRSTYNKYAEGGKTDNNSQLEEDYYTVTLPEIVVKPEEWQIDFIKNFADKKKQDRVFIGLWPPKPITLEYVRKRKY